MSISSLSSMLACLVAGKIIARFGIKRVVAICIVTITLCCVVVATAPSFTVVIIAMVVRGLCNALGVMLPTSTLINNWFGARIRGRVMGFTMMGTGIGAIILSPIIGHMIENLGWRMAYGFFGVLALVCLPPVLLTYALHPQDKGLRPLGEVDPGEGVAPAPPDRSGISGKTAVRSLLFWLFIPGVFLTVGGIQVWLVNGAAYLTDFGFDVIWVSYVLSLTSMALTVGKPLVGAISDRVGTRNAIYFSSAMLVSGYILSIFVGRWQPLTYLMAIVIGLGQATTTVLLPLLTRDLFGNKDYVTLNGFMQSAQGFSYFLIPILASAVFEWTGSYVPAWLGVCGCVAVGLTLVTIAYRLQPKLMARAGAPEHP
jgi:MFS family permease